MLGYKKVLWTTVLFTAMILGTFVWLSWEWYDLMFTSIPDHPFTALFYHVLMVLILASPTGKLVDKFRAWNRKRYDLEYDLMVNNLIYEYIPLIAYKLNRYQEFKEFNELLRKASKALSNFNEVVLKERRDEP